MQLITCNLGCVLCHQRISREHRVKTVKNFSSSVSNECKLLSFRPDSASEAPAQFISATRLGIFWKAAKFLVTTFGVLCIHAASISVAHAQSSACGANETLTTFSFAAGSWPAGSLSQNFNAGTGLGAVNIGFTIAGPNQNAGTPQNATRGGIANSLSIEMDQNNSGQTVNISIVFNKQVNKLRYVVGDVDGDPNGGGQQWQDRLTLTGANGATQSNPTLVGGSIHTIAGNQVTATTLTNCDVTDAACNVTVSHANPVTTAAIAFTSGPNIAAPTTQFIGISELAFCVPNPA